MKSCRGCGKNVGKNGALSRYRHGEICSACAVREALDGDFISDVRPRCGLCNKLMRVSSMVHCEYIPQHSLEGTFITVCKSHFYKENGANFPVQGGKVILRKTLLR